MLFNHNFSLFLLKSMWYIPKIADYLKILTDEEVKDFVLINFGKFFKCTREKLHFEPSEKKNKNFTEVADLFYISLTMSEEVERNIELIEKCQKQKLW